ncbi:MAG TPA: hypothetical protein PKO06_02100, partial [Candidatus Ozemobacteraceae bacterium]|nr:hypothetical protein [Candidatus Ozemobacteraceae bacterium]
MSTTTPTSSDKLPEIQTEAGAAPVLPPLPTVDPSVQPTVGEDLERLRQIDCLKATIVRWKTGTHPDTVIEQVLARRLSLEESRFLTPFPLRVLTALALVFAGCAGAWGGLWFVCWQLGFT